VHFNFDKSFIREVDKPVLDEAAETLKANPNVKVYVNGYCDAIGSSAYNLKLSQRRAEAVTTYLEDKGIPADQLVPQGFGKTNFVATNKTAEGRAENRRVELVPADQ
jgi:OOP family OmpA-OmpF porin